MKTLSQVEPRTPISSLPFTITNPGSYYLTTNLTGAGAANGITVQASGVTIDLHGFQLVGVPGSLNGVTVSSPQSRLAIFGGVVTGWGGVGINASNAAGSQFHHLILSQNSSHGLIAGANSTVRDCVATGNSGDGLELTASGFAENNNCQNNSLCGIHVRGNSCRVEANHLGANATSGLQVDGSQNLIVKNSAINNGTNYSIAASNDYGQILASPGAGFVNSNPWANFASMPVPTCTDNIKNGTETDVDCGGGTCSPCANGKQCSVGTDCVSGNCSGGICSSLLGAGSACSASSQCASGNCFGGYCCSGACSTGGACGANACNQSGACVYANSSTVCAAPACTGATTLTTASMCNGAGSCVAGTTVNCSPYMCSSGACQTSCASDTQCVSGYYCSAGACVPKLLNGSVCSFGSQCQSGSCADGYCCNSACTATCQACSSALTGNPNGTCAPVLAGQNDPSHPCSGGLSCNGAGVCQ